MEDHKKSASSNEAAKLNNRQRGWAMFGLILALTIIAIMLASAAPNIKTQVLREKEAEMVFRGEQMALAIARYYNNGAPIVGPINLRTPPAYGFLTELEKLKEGVNIGSREIRFVRASAMIDPMTGVEWEPVRLRDPRIGPALQAYAAFNNVTIPQEYLLLAAAPPSTSPFDDDDDDDAPIGNANRQGGATANSNVRRDDTDDDDDDDEDDDDDDDDDEDDDDDDDDDDSTITTPGRTRTLDPFASFFENGKNNLPIVGVAPRLKGKAIRPLWGMRNYEEWVFIYIPQNFQPQQQNSNPRAPNSNRPRIGQ